MENKYEIISRVQDIAAQLHAKYDDLEKMGIQMEFISEMALEVSDILEEVIPEAYGWINEYVADFTTEELLLIDAKCNEIERVSSSYEGTIVEFKNGDKIIKPR
ncbi:hypothetical protein HPB58_12875 [Priestia filamentosa]|uniref:hypothetical protein n=1 Tax=Priestia filamentosa TaxID=1402861 RepID=UPI001FB2B142|nr:hypothetical protein [Priestia filamentosa]UOE63006.1 hypothetical protein HPB58_12875 [Priestia filamentosa]